MLEECTTNPPESTQEDTPDITLSPFYLYAVNAITQPNRMVFASQYLMERWACGLGPNGLIILLAFRTRCFYNRKTGERRDSIQRPLREIADACNLSVNTVRRELQNNAALGQFVRVQADWVADRKRGGVRQVENRYTVAMDDPVHPDDMGRLQEEVRKMEMVKEKGAEDPKERARREAAENARGYRYPPSQNGAAGRTTDAGTAYKTAGPPADMGDGPATAGGAAPKMIGGGSQNGTALIDYSSLPGNTKTTLDTPRDQPPPPQDTQAVRSFSFQGEEKGQEKKPPDRPTVAASWEALATADTGFAREYRARREAKQKEADSGVQS